MQRSSDDAKRNFIAIALLIAITLLALWPVFRAGFVNWDDQDLLVQNPDLNPPTMAAIGPYWWRPHAGLYAPLTYTVYAGLARVFGMSASAFHVFSLLLHVWASVCVWLTLRRLEHPPIAAWVGAAVFAVHPIQTEAVVWIASLNTVLSGALALTALWCYVESTWSMERANRWFIAATVLFVLALFAKPSAIVLPLIVAAIEVLVLRRPLAVWWRRVTLWLVIAGVFALIARFAQPASAVAAPPLPQRLLIAADAIGFYLLKIVWPVGFAIDYGRTPQSVSMTSAIVALAAIVLLTALAWLVRRRERCALAAVVIFIAALLPVLGLTVFDFQKYSTVADRYAYLAMLAIALVVARWSANLRAVRYLTIGCVGVMMILTMRQAMIWRDSYALAKHTLRVNPRSSAANEILAATYASDRQPEQAAKHYRAALSMRPNDANVRFNYGNLLLRQNDFAAAIEQYTAARALRPNDTRILKNFGVALARDGRLDAAEQTLLDAQRIAPNDPGLARNLSMVRSLRAAAATQPS